MTDTPTTTDPPTLADDLRRVAGYFEVGRAPERLRTAADVLDALHPRILATAEALAALDPLPAPWTVAMNYMGDVRLWRDDDLLGIVLSRDDDPGYYFRDPHPTFADAVAAAIAHLGGAS